MFIGVTMSIKLGQGLRFKTFGNMGVPFFVREVGNLIVSSLSEDSPLIGVI